MSTQVATGDAPEYPLRFDVEYPEQLNRWLVLVKWILVIPHVLIVYALLFVVTVIQIIAFFAILFTTRYPRELFDFVVNVYRWQANLFAYAGLQRDEYPPSRGKLDSTLSPSRSITQSNLTAGCP
jgi:hypothetical protein